MYESLRDSMNKNIAELEVFIDDYEEDKIPKIEIEQKVVIMELKILKDLTDAMITEEKKYKDIINKQN